MPGWSGRGGRGVRVDRASGGPLTGGRRGPRVPDPVPAARDHPRIRRGTPRGTRRDRGIPIPSPNFYCEFAEHVSAELVGPHQIEAGRRLGAEHENLLAAINNAIDTDDADVGLRLVCGMPSELRQVGVELRPPAESVATLAGAAEHPLYPKCLVLAGFQAAQRGDRPRAVSLRGEALAAAERLGDPDGLVEFQASGILVNLAFSVGSDTTAAAYSEEAAEMARAAGHFDFLAGVLAAAATYRAMAGEPERAMALASEGLTVARRLGAPSFLALNLVALAAASAEEDPDRANALLRESVALRDRLGLETSSLSTQAVIVSARIGDWPQTLALAPRRSARCTGPATDRSSPPSSTSLLGRSSPPTPRPPRRSKAPHAASSPARPTAQQQHQTSRRGSWNHRPHRARSISSRHCAARPRVNSAISSATHACTSSERRVEPWMTTTPSPSRSPQSTARSGSCQTTTRPELHRSRPSDCAGPDSLWIAGCSGALVRQATLVRFVWFTSLARSSGGGRGGGVAVGDGDVSCSPISRARPVSGRSIPKRCARRWHVTTRSCVARSSRTAASWSRRRVTGSTRRSRRRRMRSRPRSTRSSAWRANRGRRPGRCECVWVFIRARRRSATVTTTAPR